MVAFCTAVVWTEKISQAHEPGGVANIEVGGAGGAVGRGDITTRERSLPACAHAVFGLPRLAKYFPSTVWFRSVSHACMVPPHNHARPLVLQRPLSFAAPARFRHVRGRIGNAVPPSTSPSQTPRMSTPLASRWKLGAASTSTQAAYKHEWYVNSHPPWWRWAIDLDALQLPKACQNTLPSVLWKLA